MNKFNIHIFLNETIIKKMKSYGDNPEDQDYNAFTQWQQELNNKLKSLTPQEINEMDADKWNDFFKDDPELAKNMKHDDVRNTKDNNAKPDREIIIQDDEITNLKIALNTSGDLDVNEFIKNM